MDFDSATLHGQDQPWKRSALLYFTSSGKLIDCIDRYVETLHPILFKVILSSFVPHREKLVQWF